MPPASERSDAARWVTSDVPCFAVVGKVNMGKSAVLATLLEEDDDRSIRISPEPGETTRCQRLSLVLDGVERLRFIDTPGFQQPIQALRAIRALHGDAASSPGPDTLARFVARSRAEGAFEDECRLLEPLIEGAGVLYIVDPGVPVYDSFRAEIEILRLAGRARLAVLNRRSTDIPAHEPDWRAHLGQAFNLVRSFDAHRARFAARRDLLAALNQIDERDRAHLEATLGLLDAEWADRREQAAETIRDFMIHALALREHARYDETGADAGARQRAALAEAGRRYFERLAALERHSANALLDIYRHTAVRASAHTAIGAGLDLTRDETWQRLGLTRRQLTLLGATVGAGAGLGVDAATLGHSLGLGAILGGLGLGALAFFKGQALPRLNLDIGHIGVLGGRRVIVGPPRNANFAWVLLDSQLLRYRQMLLRTHARRGDVLPGPGDAEAGSGLAQTLSGARQKTLARWFKALERGRDPEAREPDAFAALVETLTDIERGLDTSSPRRPRGSPPSA